jgi:hypothetical protein
LFKEKEEIDEAVNRKNDLMNMAAECTAETGIEPENAQKLLLGDLSDDSREARVKDVSRSHRVQYSFR